MTVKEFEFSSVYQSLDTILTFDSVFHHTLYENKFVDAETKSDVIVQRLWTEKKMFPNALREKANIIRAGPLKCFIRTQITKLIFRNDVSEFQFRC